MCLEKSQKERNHYVQENIWPIYSFNSCTQVQSLDWEKPPGEGNSNHTSILACRIPRTEKPGGLQSMGSQRVGHD